MTDKRIKSFLEDRLEKLENIKKEREWTTSELGDIACCKQTLAFIDSLQEEPKKCMYSKDNYTDEDRKVLCDGCEEECKYNKKEEPQWLQELQSKLDSLSKEDFEKVWSKYNLYDKLVGYADKDLEKAASEYSFNIPSELFHQLTPEQQKLWRKEIEQAYNAGMAKKPVSKVWHDASTKCVEKDKEILFHSSFTKCWWVMRSDHLNWNTVDKWAKVEDLLNL